MKAVLIGSLGALADLSLIKRDCLRQAFQDNGLRLSDMIPSGSRLGATASRDDDARVPVADIMAANKRNLGEALQTTRLRRQPGLDCLLDRVAAAGLALGIVTTTPQSWLQHVLDQIALPPEVFDTIVTAEQVVVGKPEPDCYHLGAAMLAVAPEHCLALEDTAHGQLAAARAGMNVHLLPRSGDLLLPDLARRVTSGENVTG